MILRTSDPWKDHPERSPLEQLLTYFPRICTRLGLGINCGLSIPLNEIEKLALDPSSKADKQSAELLLCTRAGIDSLPSAYKYYRPDRLKKPINPREILIEFYFLHLTSQKIAGEYGCSAGFVKKLGHNGLDTFKAGFNDAVKARNYNPDYLI